MYKMLSQSLAFFALCILVVFTSFAQSLTNSAGQVIVVSGAFQEIKADQSTHVLQRGSLFFSGDTLATGTDVTAQVRFTDGTVMALYPNSRMKVDDYAYQNSGKSDRSFVTLIQGGFRALTGLISKSNPDAYKVQTPVAVIGVRGTNYGAILDKGQLYAGVWKGSISVKNDKGLILLGEGQTYNFAQVSSKDVEPVGLLIPPRQLIGQCGK